MVPHGPAGRSSPSSGSRWGSPRSRPAPSPTRCPLGPWGREASCHRRRLSKGQSTNWVDESFSNRHSTLSTILPLRLFIIPARRCLLEVFVAMVSGQKRNPSTVVGRWTIARLQSLSLSVLVFEFSFRFLLEKAFRAHSFSSSGETPTPSKTTSSFFKFLSYPILSYPLTIYGPRTSNPAPRAGGHPEGAEPPEHRAVPRHGRLRRPGLNLHGVRPNHTAAAHPLQAPGSPLFGGITTGFFGDQKKHSL